MGLLIVRIARSREFEQGLLKDWRALLLLRADVELLVDLPLPPPREPLSDIIVPFQQIHQDESFSKGFVPTPLVADHIFWVPRCRFKGLELALLEYRRETQQTNLHFLCEFIRGVRYFVNKTFDSNTAHDGNPLLRVVNKNYTNLPLGARSWYDMHPHRRHAGIPCRSTPEIRAACGAPEVAPQSEESWRREIPVRTRHQERHTRHEQIGIL